MNKLLRSDLLSTSDLCKRFGISRQTVYRWRAEGMPTAVNNSYNGGKTIRYDAEEVKTWLNRNNSDHE
tara:strand:- start:238 stop:441 length:204 start_codon:yes stop_codon:yes gene_type:complete